MHIKLNDVTKKHKKDIILDNINLNFEKGKIHGVFGAHNSGKSVLLNMISGIETSYSGQILYNDKEVNDLSLCYIKSNFIMIFGFKRNLKNFIEVFPNFDLEYAYSLIEKFNLTSNRMDITASSGTLSLMRVIITLASNAEILIFDDIINGLDIFNRNLVYKEILDKYNKDKQTIFISCAYVEEVDKLLNDFIIISNKKVVANMKIEELDKCFVLTGSTDKINNFKNENCIIKNELNNFSEIILINSNLDNFKDIEVRQANLLDLVLGYGGKYVE